MDDIVSLYYDTDRPSFSQDLKAHVMFFTLFTQRKLAESVGITSQSLSRFMEDEDGEKGLETPTLERLWRYLNLYIVVMSPRPTSSDSFASVGFAEQLREAIRRSGVRPADIARETGVKKSTLSLFLSGKRPGLTLKSLERIWSYLGLRIGVAGGPYDSESTHWDGVDDGEPL